MQCHSINYIQVAVPAPLHGVFDYLTPETSEPNQLCVGQRILVPFGARKLIGIITAIKEGEPNSGRKTKAYLKSFESMPTFNPILMALLSWAADYYGHPIGECLMTAMPKTLKQAKLRPSYKLTHWSRTDKKFAGRNNATKQKKLLDFVESHSENVWEDELRHAGFTKSFANKLSDAGYLEPHAQSTLSLAMQVRIDSSEPILNQEQAQTCAQIAKNFGQFHASLIHGITGSGKTEVYIALVKEALKKGAQALILVPEINLTPQTFSRFQSQLGLPIATMHSGMSEKERFITRDLAETGHAQVIIGTRSAIFTPTKKLGLIIVDEEHDQSYKQFDNFKYSARDLAVKRAQLENCNIVLGSATPSAETMLNAKSGKYAWLSLHQRAGAGRHPSLGLIDMRAHSSDDALSQPLLKNIKHQLDAGNQVIIFQNRRGFSPTLMCYDCGWICPCPNCDTRLSVHQHPMHLQCHHCGHKQTLLHQCANCNSTNIQPVGSGTERLEQSLNYHFPYTSTVRLDRDQIKTQTDMECAIEIINKGEPCLIIGTQMLAKGHDFHNVTLVAIIDSDALFFSSDFRATEKGLQQLLQVAGRTGRGDKKGHVLIQTRHPDHPIFEHIRDNDYLTFIEEELEIRERCALPPYSRMLTLRSEAASAEKAERALAHAKNIIQPMVANNSCYIAGPIAAVISRKQNIYRYYLHIFADSIKRRTQLANLAPQLAKQAPFKQVRLSVDVDPMDYI